MVLEHAAEVTVLVLESIPRNSQRFFSGCDRSLIQSAHAGCVFEKGDAASPASRRLFHGYSRAAALIRRSRGCCRNVAAMKNLSTAVLMRHRDA